MSRKRLSRAVVAKRLIRLRNLEKLHRVSKQTCNTKDELIAAQAKQLDRFEVLVINQQELIETQAIRIAELEAMVFGKKKRPPIGGSPIATDDQVDLSTSPGRPRDKSSYHRPVPATGTVTTEMVVPLPGTCMCGGDFDPSLTTVHERFVEDVPLPELTPGYDAKLITKYLVSRGICVACGKPTTQKDLGGAQVSLGPNVRLLVTHLIGSMGMSYSQVASLLLSLYSLTVTDGEIANILQKQHQVWLPAYTKLRAEIRAAPVVHGDETSWPIQDLQGAGYAWNMCDAGSPKVCFALEQSRGAIYAQKLFGQDTDMPFTGIRITDDYGAYRNQALPGSQQLCWVHLYRVIRDLRYNANLPVDQLQYVMRWYEDFAAIYQDLRLYLDEPYDMIVRETQAEELWGRIQKLANQETPRSGEPQKLSRLKAQLQRSGKDRLLICLPKDTPCDNNRAERDLRQLVLKRKRSFGSKSEKGAQALATLMSLCTTTWRTSPEGYFSRLAALAG